MITTAATTEHSIYAFAAIISINFELGVRLHPLIRSSVSYISQFSTPSCIELNNTVRRFVLAHLCTNNCSVYVTLVTVTHRINYCMEVVVTSWPLIKDTGHTWGVPLDEDRCETNTAVNTEVNNRRIWSDWNAAENRYATINDSVKDAREPLCQNIFPMVRIVILNGPWTMM